MDRVLNAWESQKLLEDMVPFAPSAVFSDVFKALNFARAHYPVALKALSPVHKTDAGAVILNVSDDDNFMQSFYRLQNRFGGEILVQKQMRGLELFVGGKMDPQFGPVVLFGLGGIFVEVYRDVSARVAPFDPSEAEEMMREIRGARILSGYRGHRVDTEELARLLSRFSEFLAGREDIKEVDLNPVIASTDGIYAVDARVVLR